MTGTPGEPFYAALKALGYVALAVMAASAAYAGVMALRYWPGIGV